MLIVRVEVVVLVSFGITKSIFALCLLLIILLTLKFLMGKNGDWRVTVVYGELVTNILRYRCWEAMKNLKFSSNLSIVASVRRFQRSVEVK